MTKTTDTSAKRKNDMNSRYETPEAVRHDAHTLAENARSMIEATANIADEKITEARERLAEALERGKMTYDRVKEKAIESAKAADETIRTHPYHTAGITFGVGVLLGVLIARRGNGN
ncbi:MAG: hypothetical protein QOF48_2570 [Verrucomicrobiota bacterium]|jgi:ElaB/YqjD/DUF883 family membrane-anchored ribosome-binding protein